MAASPTGRLLAGAVLLTVLLPGCTGSDAQRSSKNPDANGAAGPPTQGEAARPRGEHPAIKQAKATDRGEGLPPGASREVATANGVVIVSKDERGQVHYALK